MREDTFGPFICLIVGIVLGGICGIGMTILAMAILLVGG